MKEVERRSDSWDQPENQINRREREEVKETMLITLLGLVFPTIK